MYKMQSYLKELPVPVEFYGDELMPTAIVIRANEKVEGIKFYSPESYSQQLGLMTRPEGYAVEPMFTILSNAPSDIRKKFF